jgi:hypothetical protein
MGVVPSRATVHPGCPGTEGWNSLYTVRVIPLLWMSNQRLHVAQEEEIRMAEIRETLTTEEKPKKRRTWLIVVIVLVVLCCIVVVCGGGGWWLWTNGDELLGDLLGWTGSFLAVL